MARIFLLLLRGYKLLLSPLLGQNCRFLPSCSEYAQEAIERYGASQGIWLGLRRLGRCHPIKWLGGSAGFDPVPTDLTHYREKE